MVSTCCGKWPMVNTSSNSGRKMEKREKQNEKEVYGKRQRDIGRKRVRGRKKERKKGRKKERKIETQTSYGDTMAQREREIIAEDESRGTNLL